MKKTKKLYLKKKFDYTLITINCFIICFIACIDDFTSIKEYLLLVLILGIIFYINCKILKKYSRILKDNKE